MLHFFNAFNDTNFIIKTKYILLLSFPLSLINIILNIISDWAISNHTYISGVLLCIAIDHLLGSIFHLYKLKDFTFRKNILGLLRKLGLCTAGALVFEIIHNTLYEIPFIYSYLKTVTRLVVILYPASSALLTISFLTNGKFPPLSLIKKINQFNVDLDVKQLVQPHKK